MSRESSARVLFRVVGRDGDVDVETLWAIDVGSDRYRLDNCPFYAYGVSLDDVVHAPFREEDGLATFSQVVEKSGNRTVRVILPGAEQDDHLLEAPTALGCSYEGMYNTLISVTVPKGTDLGAAIRMLAESSVDWEHADPTWEDLHADDQPNNGG